MTFANFTAAGSIPSSALGFNRNNGFSVSTDNFAGALTFENATPFYLETPHADKAAVFFDRDGAVSGAAGAYVVPNVPFMVSGGCTARPDWNAQVCPNRYVGLDVRSDAETVAPLTLVRDDALSLALVGVPNAPTRADASVIPGRGYTLQFSGTVPLHPRDAGGVGSNPEAFELRGAEIVDAGSPGRHRRPARQGELIRAVGCEPQRDRAQHHRRVGLPGQFLEGLC